MSVASRSAAGLLTLLGIGVLLAGWWWTEPRSGADIDLGPAIRLAHAADERTRDASPFAELRGEGDRLYSLRIDCAHGAIRREGTAASYTIIGVSEQGAEVSFTPWEGDEHRLTEEDCRRGVAPFSPEGALPDTLRIRRIQIALDAGRRTHDALFLDALQLTLTSSEVPDSMAWDVDGGDGWCLSEDASDARGDWRSYVYDGRCYPCVEFSLVPLAEGDSIGDGDWRHTAAPGYTECLPPEDGSVPVSGDLPRRGVDRGTPRGFIPR